MMDLDIMGDQGCISAVLDIIAEDVLVWSVCMKTIIEGGLDVGFADGMGLKYRIGHACGMFTNYCA